MCLLSADTALPQVAKLGVDRAICSDHHGKIVSSVCNIVLTGRDMGIGNRVPLAGVPYHAVDNYSARLIQAGHKVAIVEQTSDEAAKGLMTREVVFVVSSLPLMKIALHLHPPTFRCLAIPASRLQAGDVAPKDVSINWAIDGSRTGLSLPLGLRCRLSHRWVRLANASRRGSFADQLKAASYSR